MENNNLAHFNKVFSLRGCSLAKKILPVAVDTKEGDAFLLSLAENYAPVKDGKSDGGVPASLGVNADGTLSFTSWFSAYFRARHAQKIEGKFFPSAVSEKAWNEACAKAGYTDLIVSPGIIRNIGLEIRPKTIYVAFGFYAIPVWSSRDDGTPTYLTVTPQRIQVIFPRVDGKESDYAVAEKFIKFALSFSQFTLSNLAHCAIRGLNKEDATKLFETYVGAGKATLGVYANPVIEIESLKGAEEAYHWAQLLHPMHTPLMELIDVYERASEGGNLTEIGEVSIGKFGGDYWADYLMYKALGVKASYGRFFEETAFIALSAEMSGAKKDKLDNLSGADAQKILRGDDEDETPEPAKTEDVASSAPIYDEDSDFVNDDDTDEDMAYYGSRVNRILNLYDNLYAGDLRGKFAYKYVAVSPKADSPVMRLYTRKTTNIKGETWNPDAPFAPIKGAKLYHVSELNYSAFCKSLKNLWKGLASSYGGAPVEPYGINRMLPKDANDFEWLKSVIANGELTVCWFPFIHIALMKHIAPWDVTKEDPKVYKWNELRDKLQKWFLAVFRALGSDVNNSEASLNSLCEVFMRHLVVAGGNMTFTFSCYWGKAVKMDVPSLSAYFKAADISVADDSEAELLNEVNTLVTCDSSNVLAGLFVGGFTPDLKGYLGDTLLGYDVVLDYLNSHNGVLLPKEIPLGQSFRGNAVTINLEGGQNVYPAVVRAGARSGKGVLTQLLMITMLGCGKPFVYFDDKPDMSKTWIDWGRKHESCTLAADIRADYRQFALAEPGEPLNPCQYAVMTSSDYIGLLNFIYFGKLVGLLGGLVQARLKKEDMFRKDDLFVFLDEVNKMGGDLKSISIPKNPMVGVSYAEARKVALAMYKKSHSDAVILPPDQEITVQGIGTYTVAQWDAVLGADGKCTRLNKKLSDMVGALGKFVGSLSKDAPVAHVYGVLIGQTTPMNLNSMEASFGENVGKAFREASRLALFGRYWGDMESAADELKGRLETVSNAQLTDLTAGIFLYKKGASESFSAIKTGVVLAENDILSLTYDEEKHSWEGGDKDFAKMLLGNVEKAAGTEASKTFAQEKLIVTERMQKLLAANGMNYNVGDANPLVTFDGLLEYVANKTGKSPTEPVQRLYDEFSKLLSVTGSGFADVYTYLLDPSAIYAEEDFMTALSNGTSLIQGSADNGGNSGILQNIHVDLGDEDSGVGTMESHQTPYTANMSPVSEKKNPARVEAGGYAPVRPMPTFESAMANTEGTFDNEMSDNSDSEYTMPDLGGEAMSGEYAGDTSDIDYYAGSAEDGGAVISADEYESGETPMTSGVGTPVRTTPAPVVCGTQGASSRYAGGVSPYAENPDDSVTLEVPGGRVNGYYTAAETVTNLSRMFTNEEALKYSQTPKGRAYMALKGMQRLVEMLEQKTGLNRAMIKSVTFADNCLFVRDACVVGGKPDAYDLYDYIDIKNFLKTMSGLTVLQMDRDAYFNLIIRPGYDAQSAFLFSQTLQTFQFDNCQLLRDGRVVGNAPDAVRDSFISQFDRVATENAIPTSKSKLFSGAFLRRAEREQAVLHTPEYTEKQAHLTKMRRDLLGQKAEQFIQEDRPIAGFISSIRFWLLDRKLARLQAKL